jgi:hypothetical protein
MSSFKIRINIENDELQVSCSHNGKHLKMDEQSNLNNIAGLLVEVSKTLLANSNRMMVKHNLNKEDETDTERNCNQEGA